MQCMKCFLIPRRDSVASSDQGLSYVSVIISCGVMWDEDDTSAYNDNKYSSLQVQTVLLQALFWVFVHFFGAWCRKHKTRKYPGHSPTNLWTDIEQVFACSAQSTRSQCLQPLWSPWGKDRMFRAILYLLYIIYISWWSWVPEVNNQLHSNQTLITP